VNQLFGGLALLAAAMIGCVYFYKWGQEEGYKKGRKDEESWWGGVEQDVDKAREKIWREESQQP
jgi:hypothetical protein